MVHGSRPRQGRAWTWVWIAPTPFSWNTKYAPSKEIRQASCRYWEMMLETLRMNNAILLLRAPVLDWKIQFHSSGVYVLLGVHLFCFVGLR